MASNSNASGALGAFIGGVILGAGVALLLTPVKGADLRTRLKKKLNEHSIIMSDVEVDELIARLEEDDAEIAY